MLLLALREVSRVPFETDTFCQQIDEVHELCIYMIYTFCQGFRW